MSHYPFICWQIRSELYQGGPHTTFTKSGILKSPWSFWTPKLAYPVARVDTCTLKCFAKCFVSSWAIFPAKVEEARGERLLFLLLLVPFVWTKAWMLVVVLLPCLPHWDPDFSLFIIGTIQASIISSKRSTLNRELTTHCLIVFSDCIYRCVSWRRSHREELGVSRIRIRPELRFAFHRKKKHYIMSEGLRFPKEGGGFPKFSV